MTLRSRPVLDRKHRPRWQDELRTQQLTVIAFAVAIALALGIFGAVAWNNYWESHFRPVASVAGATFDRTDLDQRERILTAEAVAQVTELQAQLSGGLRDQIIQQQIDSLSVQFSSLESNAAQSLVDQAVLAERAGDYGVSVSEDDVDAGIEERFTLPERVQANLILVDPLPEDAEPDAEPTNEQLAAATEEAAAAVERLEGGEDFATVASELSDDFTAQAGGNLGWFGESDSAYAEYFELLADAEEGELVGPAETANGVAVLELVSRREETREGGLSDILADQGVDEATYREYVRGELLVEAYRDHFSEEVVTSPAEQRRVAQIVLAPVTGAAVPQERARHILVQPNPDLEDQAEASDEEWDAAFEEAQQVQELAAAEDADWFALAEEHSDDPGSASRGGDLGWYDPANSPFVEEFTVTTANLEVGEVSDPIRTQFGWHVIQKTGERESPQEQAADLVEQLRADPDSFGAVASEVSEDPETAVEDGELGWVARYQLDAMREDAIFGLTEVGEISEPIETTTDGITIYQLLEISESLEIETERLEEIRSAGFERWLDEEVRAPIETWVDPQYSTSAAPAA
jgi:parvulin-like peptidyl-prolyl isomerase